MAIIAAPSYASKDHKDIDGVSGDGNTNPKHKNLNKPIYSGFDNNVLSIPTDCVACLLSPSFGH